MKRREAKSKGEKERYKHLNAEFQKIARRDKKAFLSDHAKEFQKNIYFCFTDYTKAFMRIITNWKIFNGIDESTRLPY